MPSVSYYARQKFAEDELYLIDEIAIWKLSCGIDIEVRILDNRQRKMGSVDYLVEPVSGEGKQWVSAKSLRPIGG